MVTAVRPDRTTVETQEAEVVRIDDQPSFHAPKIIRLPIPNSWYALAFSDQLPPGGVITRKLANQDVVLYRSQSGVPSAVDAICPHLGAHLGIGGTVEGDQIRCPFHGFKFDQQGRCTETGYGTPPPPKARLKVWPLIERNGILFVYYDSENRRPTWEPPQLDQDGWTKLRYSTFNLRDHPQETVENGLDIGHFGIVHGYRNVQILRDLVTDGPYFSTAYAAERDLPVLGRFGASMRFEMDMHIYGLGCSIVQVSIPRFDIVTRLFVLAVPISDERINLSFALSMREMRNLGRISPLLKPLPKKLVTTLTHILIHRSLIQDAHQDFDIWQNKRYLHPPALAEGDGPIGRYRIWARQFYNAEGVAMLTGKAADTRAAAAAGD